MFAHIRLLVFLGISFLSLRPANAKFFIDEKFISGGAVVNTSTFDSNIIEDIQSGKFKQAEEGIRQIDEEPLRITNIFKALLESNKTNLSRFYINCAPSTRILIKYSLYYEMWDTVNTYHYSVYDLINLYKEVTREIINNEQTSEEIRIKARDMLDNGVRYAIIRIAKETLKAAVFDGTYQNNSDIKSLAKALESFDEQISDDIIRMVVEELFFKMTVTDLIRNVYNNESVSQSVLALASINQRLSPEEDLYGMVGMVFADHLSRLQEIPDYEKLSEDKKRAATSMVNRISSSIRNLYFTQKICIRNALYLEDLYSPEDRYAWRETRRNVFTRSQVLADIQSIWIPRKNADEGSQFRFESEFNKDEYLYVPNVQNQFRRVMTASPSSAVGIGYTVVWKIEAIKSELVLLNVQYKEYLCLSNEKYSANLRYVFTKRDEQGTHPKQCRWVVNVC